MKLLYKDQPILSFQNQEEWRSWLDQNHAITDGIWLRMYKKASGITKVNYDQALEEALCYGWIDGIVHKYDEVSYIQKFTPRRKQSMWSEINKNHIDRLTRLGKMHSSGIFEVERAKKDGRWDAAYASPSNTEIPEDFERAISKNKKAEEFWTTLSKTNKYAMIWQINTAKKEETRVRRIEKFIGMLERGEKFY
jgi:uncharacterized protein YdeI (YjbR/CyaY-like superfamily)